MNPQTPEQDSNQQFTVNDTTQPAPEPVVPMTESTSEADAAALQQIDALESESQVVSAPEAPTSALPSQPAMTPVSPNPESAQTVVASDAPAAPVTPQSPADMPATQPVQPAPQPTIPFTASSTPAKKKPFLIVSIVVGVVLVGVAAGYFVWQSMGK